MNTSVMAGWVRHVLTALGVNMALVSDDELVKIIGAVITLAGLLWSAWQKTSTASTPPAAPTKTGGTGADAAGRGDGNSHTTLLNTLLCLLPGCLLLSGCATILPGNDPVVVRAEQVLDGSFEVVNAFLAWEYATPDAPAEASQAAETLRATFPASHRAAQTLLETYKANKTQQNRADLDTLLAVLVAAKNQAVALLSAGCANAIAPPQ